MKRNLICSILCSIGFICAAQDNTPPRIRNLFLKAADYKTHFLYTKAIENYKKILTYKQDSYDAMINMADCYFKLKDFPQTKLWYDSASKHTSLLPPHGLQYANTLLSLGEPDKAKIWLENYLQVQPDDQQAKEKLSGIVDIDLFFKDSSRYSIQNLPINSNKPEFSPALYDKGIIVVSREKTDAYLDLLYYECQDGDSAEIKPLGKSINSNLNEGPATVYDHDTKMIFTRNQKTKKGLQKAVDVVHFQLFYTEKDGTGEWREPQLLSINDKAYSMGHPSITADGKTLYFSSNIPGGLGGSDIYKSTWQNSAWGQPQNLGAAVNTSGNEMFPFIFNDSIVYFASDGYKGLGGLDIYKVNIQASGKGVFNVGYPINSRKDDFSIVMYADGMKGFFASNRDGGKGNDDIYEFILKPGEVNPLPPAEKIEVAPVTVFYTVQILALRNPKLVNRKFMKTLQGVVRHKGKDGIHRYTYGEYEGVEDALAMLNNIRAMGYEDAFIRHVEKYSELSEGQGENTDLLYEKMGRSNK
jgi:tetratricopeptide (TPR) repeat protein